MTKNVFIVPIEPIDTRYTRQWYEYIPVSIEKEAQARKLDVNIVVIDGEQVPPRPTPGAFLDFGATNIWKSTQMATVAEQFQHGKVNPHDVFLFTDAWNPTVLQLKYMSELLNIPVKIHGMHHAGSYDPQDFLGRLIGNKPWVRLTEKAMFECYDTNWFATGFHMDMFIREQFGPFLNEAWEPTFDETKHKLIASKKVDLTGWPMDYLVDLLKPYSTLPKRPLITFPHRIAPEKQLEIFKDLAAAMPQYEWKVCQETPLTKHEYHTILGESTMVFSANLQETLGISSCAEAPLTGCIPLCPDRLSYSEIFKGYERFLYPSEWTESHAAYETNKQHLINRIKDIMSRCDEYQQMVSNYSSYRFYQYFKAESLISRLLE